MEKKTFVLLGMLVLFAPVVSGAENPALDSSGSSGAQQNPFGVVLKPGAGILSKASIDSSKENLSGGEALPVLISMSKPILYPGWARRKGSEGLLVVALEILENGTVGRWRIIQSTGEESLDKVATKAFLTWKFQPAMKNGEPVKTCIQVPINFELTKE
jgi:protein TonB